MTVLFEQRELPVVSIGIANPFGAAFEESKIKGIAHFIEHLVFTGTKTRNHEDISREIEKRGGVLNAYTANEVTCFLFKLPSEHLFAGLDILQDIMQNPLFNKDKFEKEKKVILEEIKMYHDNPQTYVFEKIVNNLYRAPFGEGVIGSEKTIKSLERDFVYDYYSKNYDPRNYIITIVGKADIKKVCEYLEKTFKPVNNKKNAEPLIEKINRETIEEREGIDQAHFLFAMHAPLPSDKAMYALEVLDAYLANGMSSHLFLTIREERGLAYSIRSSINAEKRHAYYTIYVGTRKEVVNEVRELIIEGFKKMEKITEAQVKEAKEKLIGLRKISKEESLSVMNELLSAELVGNVEDYYAHEKKIKEVKIEDVRKIAKLSSFSTASVIPK